MSDHSHRRKLLFGLVCLLAVLFASLFVYRSVQLHAKQQRIDALASQYITDAYRSFSDFLSEPSPKNYTYGSSSFYAFKSIYPEASCYDAGFENTISQTYAKLLFADSPDSLDISALVYALSFLSVDPTDIQGYTALSTFID